MTDQPDAPTWEAFSAANRALEEWHRRRHALLVMLDQHVDAVSHDKTRQWARDARKLLEEPIGAPACSCVIPASGFDLGQRDPNCFQHGGPDAGHTFSVWVHLRGSSKVVGDAHHHDVVRFEDLGAVQVRAWNLRDALARAAALPLDTWPGLCGETDNDEQPPESTHSLRWRITRLLARQLGPSIGRYRTTRITDMVLALITEATPTKPE